MGLRDENMEASALAGDHLTSPRAAWGERSRDSGGGRPEETKGSPLARFSPSVSSGEFCLLCSSENEDGTDERTLLEAQYPLFQGPVSFIPRPNTYTILFVGPSFIRITNVESAACHCHVARLAASAPYSTRALLLCVCLPSPACSTPP